MKILHVIDYAGVGGGAEAIALNSANSLEGENFLYYYIREDSLNENNFPNVTFIKSNKEFSFLNLISNVIELKKIIKEKQIDIVHSHLFWSNMTARLATPKSVKLFTSIHNVQSKSSLSTVKMQLLERFLYRKDETTFCVSNEVNNDYKKIVPSANTITLYNFIADDFFKEHSKIIKINQDHAPIKFIAVGLIKPQKNYQLLINVFNELKKRGRSNIYLDVYGGGELRSQFQKQVKELEINVDFKGEILNLSEVYPHYDAFIMASLYEGYGIAILEALASGLPALLSDINVIKEVTNSNAIFFDANSLEDCLEKILAFCDNKYNVSELIENGRSWAKKTAQKSVYINTVIQYYNQ